MQDYPGPFPKKSWTKQERDQIKSFPKKLVRKLLDKDIDWEFTGIVGGRATYRSQKHKASYDYIAVHTSTDQYSNPSLLFWMIDHICWTSKELRKWKAIK